MRSGRKYAYNGRVNTTPDHNLIIDSLGGTTSVARLFKIAPQAVSQWRISGIPDARLMYLQLLRPDLFPTEQKAA